MNDNKPRFAIMGSGGVGGYFGGRLAQSGHETAFVARGAHLDAIKAAGLRVEDPDRSFTLTVNATDKTEEIGPVDFVIFSVKLWDTESAVNACRPLIGPETAVLSLQNGVDSECVPADLDGSAAQGSFTADALDCSGQFGLSRTPNSRAAKRR